MLKEWLDKIAEKISTKIKNRQKKRKPHTLLKKSLNDLKLKLQYIHDNFNSWYNYLAAEDESRQNQKVMDQILRVIERVQDLKGVVEGADEESLIDFFSKSGYIENCFKLEQELIKFNKEYMRPLLDAAATLKYHQSSLAEQKLSKKKGVSRNQEKDDSQPCKLVKITRISRKS